MNDTYIRCYAWHSDGTKPLLSEIRNKEKRSKFTCEEEEDEEVVEQSEIISEEVIYNN